MQTTPSLPCSPSPTSGPTTGTASIFPTPVPSPRLGGILVPLPGRHMWFQLAAEWAFPSQTVGPCQGPSPTGVHKKGHLKPSFPTGHPRKPRGLSPVEDPAVLPHHLLSPGAELHAHGSRDQLCPASIHGRLPARLPLRSHCLQQAERDGRRAGCQGAGGREGRGRVEMKL